MRERPLVGSNEFLPWEEILIDTINGFNTSKSVFTVPESGIYLTHFSAGIPPYGWLNVALNGSTNSPNILMNYYYGNAKNGEVISSRDDIQFWRKGEQIYLSSGYNLNSDGMYQTSWSAVRIDNIMEPAVAFCLARTSDFDDPYVYPLQFTNVKLSVGSDLGVCTHQFVAPQYGTYFISFSVGISDPNGYSNTYVHLRVDGSTKSAVYVTGQNSYDSDISSNSLLLSLNEGSVVNLYYYSSSISAHYSDKYYQTALTGFLYEPVHGYNIAWTVTHCCSNTFYGPIQAFPFDYVMLNNGGAWNIDNYKVTIPISGIYWLKLSGKSFGLLNMILSVNSQTIINVAEKITNAGGNVRSHSIAYRLKRGDKLQVSIPTGFMVETISYATSFSGFLINPDVL